MNNLNGHPQVTLPPSRVILTRQRASRGAFKVTLSVPPHKLRQLQPLPPPKSIMRPTRDPPKTLTPSNLYLPYAPNPRSSNLSQNQFFEKLGFKSAETSRDMRNKFIADMNDHVQNSSHKFLNKTADPEAFKILVAKFLDEYGPIYWGNSTRDHLEEQNIHQGFLCPRDALRADSRLVAVVESFFNYQANNARRNHARTHEARRSNRNLGFTALTEHKTDLTHPPDAAEPTPPDPSRRRRRPVISDDEESNEPSRTQDNDRSGPENSDANGRNEQPFSADNTALPRHDSKRPRLSPSLHIRETTQDIKAHISSPDPHPPNLPSTHKSPQEQDGSHLDAAINLVDSDDDKKQRRERIIKRSTSPAPATLDSTARVRNEHLSPEMTSRIKLRVNADGPRVKDRGSILVDFEVYKTSRRLFTALMSERNLKPEMQKKVSELSVTIEGKKMGCRRDRWNDWSEICGELRELWDIRPELFKKRLVVDVMLYVDD